MIGQDKVPNMGMQSFFNYEVSDLEVQIFKYAITKFQIFGRVKLDSQEYKIYNMLL